MEQQKMQAARRHSVQAVTPASIVPGRGIKRCFRAGSRDAIEQPVQQAPKRRLRGKQSLPTEMKGTKRTLLTADAPTESHHIEHSTDVALLGSTSSSGQFRSEKDEDKKATKSEHSQGAGNASRSLSRLNLTPKRCTREVHICVVSEAEGCTSCHRMCHKNCCDVLCSFVPCPICLSRGRVTHDNSHQCQNLQREMGCHACERVGCFSSSHSCPRQISYAHLATNVLSDVSQALQDYARNRLNCRIRSLEVGGGGDCLFHSFATVLAKMLTCGADASEHVFARMTGENDLQHFVDKPSIVRYLRQRSAQAFEGWEPEAVFDLILTCAVRQRLGSFEDEWDPENLLVGNGFACLQNTKNMDWRRVSWHSSTRRTVTLSYEWRLQAAVACVKSTWWRYPMALATLRTCWHRCGAIMQRWGTFIGERRQMFKT